MPVFNGTYTITNFQSHTRLDLAAVTPPKETKVVGWEPHKPTHPDYLNQVWTIQPNTERKGFDAYTIVNKRSGTFLELLGGNSTDGFGVTCSKKASDDDAGAVYQEWEFVKIKDGYYKVRNVASQNFLDIDSGYVASCNPPSRLPPPHLEKQH
ncbi:carbohydrate-binding module family 13 protein [Favolaschia claudopus]|uniref:Carbohydrate-binding module family 13 protein n=1 Tax=Favolaschia claudopus TaxID=2862362 RepID=A0AAW0CIP8_9AGAR